jgi:hypothetical protein
VARRIGVKRNRAAVSNRAHAIQIETFEADSEFARIKAQQRKII